MSRKAGTPNKPKSIDVSSFNKELIEDEIIKLKTKIRQETTPYYEKKYLLIHSENETLFHEVMNTFLESHSNYVCQGGVSVTNYRADNGSIVMVYCQALVKKE